tara:strand:- start:3717 stop:4886 length:1170 start_codon:yes stop_codon:yes gene_type:complete
MVFHFVNAIYRSTTTTGSTISMMPDHLVKPYDRKRRAISIKLSDDQNKTSYLDKAKIVRPVCEMPEYMKTALIPCKFFLAGRCKEGNRCRFNHGMTESVGNLVKCDVYLSEIPSDLWIEGTYATREHIRGMAQVHGQVAKVILHKTQRPDGLFSANIHFMRAKSAMNFIQKTNSDGQMKAVLMDITEYANIQTLQSSYANVVGIFPNLKHTRPSSQASVTSMCSSSVTSSMASMASPPALKWNTVGKNHKITVSIEDDASDEDESNESNESNDESNNIEPEEHADMTVTPKRIITYTELATMQNKSTISRRTYGSCSYASLFDNFNSCDQAIVNDMKEQIDHKCVVCDDDTAADEPEAEGSDDEDEDDIYEDDNKYAEIYVKYHKLNYF